MKMNFRTVAVGTALVIFGLGAAVGIGLAANAISGDSVGLSADPLSAGDELAPGPASAGYQGVMIGFIVAGLIIGALARLLLPGKQKIGLLWTLGLGLLGSVIGGTIANLIDTGDIFELNFIGFIAAVVASVGLLAVAERAGLGQPPERKQLGH